MIPISEMRKINELVRGSRLEVIPGAGHLPFLENPQAVALLLTAHLHVRVRE